MDTIVINHKEIKIVTKINSHLKYNQYRVNSYGEIELIFKDYRFTDISFVIPFIKKDANFIQKQLDILKQMELPTFKNESTLYIFGKKHKVYRSKRITRIIRNKNAIAIPRNFKIDDIRDYLEELLLTVVEKLMSYYIHKYRFEYQESIISESHVFWGRCNQKEYFEKIEFNVALVFVPIKLIEYIVVHELCHLKQMNHSKLFWQEVENIMPDARKRRKELHAHHLEWYLERLDIKRRRFI